MTEDYGQFVELDFDNGLEDIHTFQIKTKIYNENNNENFNENINKMKFYMPNWYYLLKICLYIVF